MNMKFYHKLPIPQDVKAHYPVTDSMKAVKAKRDKEIKDVFEGKSDKFLLVIGPCSADRNDSVLDYIGRLKKVSEQVEDKIIIIPRIYTNKPRTTGDGYKGMLHLSIMMNAITAGHHSHTFIYRGWEVESLGNPLSHAILRGFRTTDGQNVSNYHYEDLVKLNELYQKSGLENPAVIVDTNHSNSGKKFREQPRIALDVIHSMRENPDIRKLCKGLMIESYIEDGAQKTDGDVYGRSITDPCLGWEKTEKLIFEIADKL